VPWKLTAVAPVKPLPVIVTTVATGPLPGVKETMLGGGSTVNGLPLRATPPSVVTLMVAPPVAVALAMVALIEVSEFTVKVLAAVAWKLTAVAPVRPEPVIVTTVPTGPLPGVKETMSGGGSTLNWPLLAALPLGVVTLIVAIPVTVLLAMVAVIEMSEFTV